MEAAKPELSFRTYAVMALVIGVVVTVTAVLALTSTPGTNGSSSSSSSPPLVSTTTAAAPGLGIQLALSVSPGQGAMATSFEVNASVWNTLSRSNNVTGVDDYHGVQVNPLCNTGPVTFEVLQGYYTVANFTSGTVISIHGVQNMMCIVPTSALSYYVFRPNSDVFTGPLSQEMSPQNGTAAMTTRSATTADSLVDIYSSGLGNPTPFPVGTYTVVAADNWGQVAAVHFTVTS